MGTPTVNSLPDEIMMNIFSSLELKDLLSASLACKRWYLITSGKEFMSNVVFTINCCNVKAEDDYTCDSVYISCINCLRDSQRVFKSLRFCSLSLTFSSDYIQKSWSCFGKNITDLQLSDCSISDVDFIKLLGFCPCLGVLRMNDTYHYYTSKSNRVYDEVDLTRSTATLQNLTVVDLSGTRSFGLSDYFFVHVIGKCRNLIELNMSGCKILFHPGIIRRFYFNSGDHWQKPTDYGLTFPILYHFLFHFGQKLRILDFSNTSLTRSPLLQVARMEQLNSLCCIRIKNCKNLEESAIEEIRNIRPNIEYVY